MIKLEKTEVVGWEPAIRGMRNPMNSWEKSDSKIVWEYSEIPRYEVGPNDHDLMMRLAEGGPVHAKYRRMITVYVDITAPLYWWKEFDTYKVGTVANSCSTMHKIHEKKFTMEDFSHEHLFAGDAVDGMYYSKTAEEEFTSSDVLDVIIEALNHYRELYISCPKELAPEKKDYWWQMIQLLPSSYNQKRTIELNYEVLVGIYKHRKNHKLDEWRELCSWIESLPYSEIITGVRGDEEV